MNTAATALTALLTFLATNLDDLLVLMLLWGMARDARDGGKIILGQYLGIGLTVGISLLAAMGLTIVPDKYIRLLGLVPLALGIRALIHREEEKDEPLKMGVLSVTLLALADGGDNLGVYIPLFRSISWEQTMVTLGIYSVLVVLWCLMARGLTELPGVGTLLEKGKRWLVPVVFLGLGIWILLGI